MPTMPGSGLVVVETKFILGGLKAVLNRPAVTLDADQRLDRRSCRTPRGEVSEIAIGDVASDEQASCPQAVDFIVELVCLEIGQFAVAPVMQPWPFGPRPGG